MNRGPSISRIQDRARIKRTGLMKAPGPQPRMRLHEAYRLFISGEITYANCNDRTWKNGVEYGAQAAQSRPRVCGVQSIATADRGTYSGKSCGRRRPYGRREQAEAAAGALVEDSGSAGRQHDADLMDCLDTGDTPIDGGNSYYVDDKRRAKKLALKGIHYVDVGTSGGVWGLDRGYCMMIGGNADVINRLDPIFRSLAPGRGNIPRTPGREQLDGTAELGYFHCGPNGAGHFVKMVHNGIEYRFDGCLRRRIWSVAPR